MAQVLTTSHYQIIDRDHHRVGDWMRAMGSACYRDGATCIGLERKGRIVAATMYDYFNGASVFAHIAIQGPITRQWLWYIFYYPFVQMGANIIFGMVPEGNLKSAAFAKRLGFTLAHAVADADPSGMLLFFTMRRDECRFLRG